MNIRCCTPADHTVVADLYDTVTAYLAVHINYPRWMPGNYPGRESTRLAIEKGQQYMCTEDDRVLGAFILNDDPQGAYEKGHWSKPLAPGEFMVIHTLAVDPSLYHRGVARTMVNYCIDVARRLGYKGVRLDVVPDNTPAARLYERCGFTYVGEEDLDRGLDHIPSFLLYELNF